MVVLLQPRRHAWPLVVMTTVLLVIASVVIRPAESAPMVSPLESVVDTCRMNSNWTCQKQRGGRVSTQVAEVCETCGRFWGNVLGLTYCCRCNDQVFAFCWEAVKGQPVL